jgi:hypothetical protein
MIHLGNVGLGTFASTVALGALLFGRGPAFAKGGGCGHFGGGRFGVGGVRSWRYSSFQDRSAGFNHRVSIVLWEARIATLSQFAPANEDS